MNGINAQRSRCKKIKISTQLACIGNSQTCFSPKCAFQPCTLRMSFEFVIAILVDQGHFTKGMLNSLSTPGDSKTCFSQSADSVICGASGAEKGWHLVRYQRDNRKALYERHFCEILTANLINYHLSRAVTELICLFSEM